MKPLETLVGANYEIVYADPPWHYYGSPDKDAAAGKHYGLMRQDEIRALPVRGIMAKRAALFLWATCPRLPYAIDAIAAWGLHYRGVAQVWVKTRKDGTIISGQGVPPTFTKPTTELLLAATTIKSGRPFPLLDHGMGQVVLAPRRGHSEKPLAVSENIVRLLGDRKRIELFARERQPGWDAWGLEVGTLVSA